MNLRGLAFCYASKGWLILPIHSFVDGCCTCGSQTCRSPAKHPITANGVKDASADPAVITLWMDQTSDKANIGVATGNGLMVLDIDAKNGGFTSLAALEDCHGKLPVTPTVSTGGGGKHFYFKYATTTEVANKTALMPGIDVRGTGGYVVAPPSVHASGQPYQWETPADTPLAPAPSWLLNAMDNPHLLQAPSAQSATMLRVQQPVPDFTTAPGVGEGERHSRLCQLTGVHLARGEDAEAVEALALAWAERCEPPMEDAEVGKTVKSLAAKHTATVVVVQTEDDIDAIPLPKPALWPVLGKDALHGLAGEVVQMIAPHTEADPVAVLVSTLVCVGNWIGRRVWFPVEGDRHHTNLFACLVGESSRARKGTSLGRTLGLWREDDLWRMHCIASGLSSGEGVKYHVRDPMEVTEPIKEKGKVVGYDTFIKDQGVADKRLAIFESEFGLVLKVVQREGNTLSPVVRQAWDTGTLRTLTRNDPTVATGAHISILGHITLHELKGNLSECDCSNGFANRFLWIVVKRSQHLPDGGKVIDLEPFRRRLDQLIPTVSGGMSRSPEARTLWHELYPVLTADRPGVWGAATSRGEAQTLRLSMIYAALDGATVIDIPHLKAAFAIWQYAEASAKLIFSYDERLAPLEQSILEKIVVSPGISRKRLHKALGGHVKAEAMVKALGRLLSLGKVRSDMVSTGGRPSECWWPAKETAVPTGQHAAAGANERTMSPSLPSSSVPTAVLTNELCPDAVVGEALRTNELTPVPTPGDSSLARTADDAAQPTVDSSFARIAPGTETHTDHGKPMNLVELLGKAGELGGKIVRSLAGGFTVEGVAAETITPPMLAALDAHRDDLVLIVPAPTVTKPLTEKEQRHAEWLQRYEAANAKRLALEEERLRNDVILTEEEFVEGLREVGQSPV